MYQTPNAGSARMVGFCAMHPFVPLFLNVLVTYFWSCWVSGPRRLPSSCAAWVSPCSGFPCGEAQPGGRRLPWLQRVGSVAVCPGLQSTDSIAGAHRFSCSKACGIFLDQESNPRLLYWQADSLLLSPRGSPPLTFTETRIVQVSMTH